MSSRETIALALFALLEGSASFVTASRRLKTFADTNSQPALFLAQVGETIDPNTQRQGLPPKKTMLFNAVVYARSGGSSESVPATALNPLLDAIETALLAQPGCKQTLGGVCVHAYISGKITTDEGTLGDQAYAIIPIEVLVV